jgi:superfamily II DNA or RNA helicase
MTLIFTYLFGVIVAPFHGELERSALAVVPNRPVVLQWHHASYKEIMVTRPHVQGH